MSRTVVVNSERVTEIDGLPFFPIAARHMPIGGDYRTLSEAGFNAVRWTPFGVDRNEGLEISPPTDLGNLLFYAYVYNRGDFSTLAEQRQRELTHLVESLRDHPNLLAYEQRNEPASTFRNPAVPQSPPEGMVAGSHVIRQLDPNHPICLGHACGNLVATLQRYNPAVDIVGCNPYVVLPSHVRQFIGLRADGRYADSPDQTLSAVGMHTDKMMRVAEGRAVWMQVQGSSNENWYCPDHTPENRGLGLYEYQRLYPNHWQMRFMAWQAVIHGATGLTWMLYGLPIESHAWRDVTSVVRELQSLHDVLASPSRETALSIEYTDLGFSDWNGVETSVRICCGQPWILAANSQFDPMEATFSNLPDGFRGQVEVVGENRRIHITNGAFSDRFQPYEVHIYTAASVA